jgi:hypothetical protein
MAATVDFEWSTMMRPDWSGAHDTLLVRGYVALRADETGFTPNPKILDLGEARVAIFVGHIKFRRPHDKTRVRVRHKYPTDAPETTEPAIELSIVPGVWEWTDPEFHTLIAAPSGDPNALAHIEETVGLLIAFEDTRLVLDQLFEAAVTPGPPVTLTVGPPPVRIVDMKEADVSDQRLKAIAQARSAIDAFDEAKRNRLLLSLRWFENATARAGSSSEVDVLLAYWIALEALAMPDDTNIKPLNETLAVIYGGDATAAKARFLTGKLCGLRSAIVHDGKRATATNGILRHLECLYVDVFFEEVGLPTEHRAADFLASHDVEADLDAALA